MSITDAISAAVTLGFAYNGWLKGFLRIALGPLSLIVATIVSYVYYRSSQNILIALLLGVIGPFVMEYALQFALRTWNKNISRNMPPSVISRTVGAGLSFLWGAGIIVLTVVLITVIPFQSGFRPLQNLQQDVRNSFIYSRLPSFGKRIPGVQQTDTAMNMLGNAEVIERIQSSEEFKTLTDDPKIKEIIKDEDTIKAIEHKDLGKLLTNQKFLKLLQDPKLIQKMMSLQSEIMPQPQAQQIQP